MLSPSFYPHQLITISIHPFSSILDIEKEKSNKRKEKKMLGKKIVSFKKLAKKVKEISRSSSGGDDNNFKQSHHQCLLIRECGGDQEDDDLAATPTGFFAIYVGEEKERFVVPTSFLSHPLFKMLLEKAYNEFGFQQKNGLMVPCSVATFQEIVSAVECSNGKFDLGKLVEELI